MNNTVIPLRCVGVLLPLTGGELGDHDALLGRGERDQVENCSGPKPAAVYLVSGKKARIGTGSWELFDNDNYVTAGASTDVDLQGGLHASASMVSEMRPPGYP